MDAQEIIAHINSTRGTSYSICGEYRGGESGIARRIVDERGNGYVLKFSEGEEFRPRRAARTTERLRSLGYPAPRYFEFGKIEGTNYSLQQAMVGTPIGRRISTSL